MLNLSELQTHWVTNYVCSHREAPRREEGMGDAASKQQQTLAGSEGREIQPVWGRQMKINKFNGRNANEMQIKINTKSKTQQETREAKNQNSKSKNRKK